MTRILTPIILLASLLCAEDNINVARTKTEPYVTPEGNREYHKHSDVMVNEARVYDFYQRQADYYMAKEVRPKLIPAFPGLDAGLHGHWGKHSQNQYKDGRWNEIEMGSILGHTVRSGKTAYGKGIAIDLGERSQLAVCFDPETLSYPFLWQGDFVKFDPFRWGTSRGATVDGKVWFKNDRKKSGWSREDTAAKTNYLGMYRQGSWAIFSFEVNGKPVLSSPTSYKADENQPTFAVAFTFPDGFEGGEFFLGNIPEDLRVAAHPSSVVVNNLEGITTVTIPSLKKKATIGIAIGSTQHDVDSGAIAASQHDLTDLIKGGQRQWPDSITTKGKLAEDQGLPYVIDTITLPTSAETGYQSVMQLTSVGFRPDGSALVATLAGEIWNVTGLDEDLNEIKWKRFAAGLHQPIGIHIDDDGIFVLERGQITRLHDLNKNGEADFYENYANDFDARNKSHTHCFGLNRGEDGSFYFVNWKDIYRTGPDRITQHYAFGVRNCMGVGTGADGAVLVGPQEGTFTPASMVIDVHEGEFYGHPGDTPANEISPPLCFIPRGIDNSTGGFVFADSERWGPLSGNTVGLSYGYATHYLVLRDKTTKRHQGAVVPLEGDFLSGIMRGSFAPHDGQLYVTGIDGWGDYSASDGCFQRVRYTEAPVRKPIGFQVHSNGIRIDFSTNLDPEKSTKLRNFFVQQWNYEYSPRYGSPEFSQRKPESLGHDILEVTAVLMPNTPSSLFLEIPDLETVMQMHIRMHLTDIDGVEFKADLFPGILELGKAYTGPGLGKPKAGKPSSIVLRTKIPADSGTLVNETGTVIEGERTINLKCSAALQFDQKLIEAKAGEPLKLVFENPDIMPHNVIFVTAGNLRKVGNLSFSMLNDPKAADKHYTPDVPEVIAGTHLVMPGGSHTLHFLAPKEPGDHHFVCTFPGHWMGMNGIFRVSKTP